MSVDQETFQLLQSSIERFVIERLIPAEDLVEERDEVPEDIISDIKDLGLYGLSIPEEYGGIGVSMSQEIELIYTISHTSFAFRSLFGTNVGIGSQGILMDGTTEQKEYWLPKFASGELTASFALTEPDAGSDAAAIRTSARADGDDYVVNGTKRFITNATRAGAFTLMARTSGEGARGISAFIVPADSAGLIVGKPDKKMGQRGTKTADVIFENVRVSKENIIGLTPGRGFYTAMKVLDRGRLHIAAQACGMADRLLSEGIRYSKERFAFGKPIADFQLIQAMIADSYTELAAGLSMLRAAGRKYEALDNGERNLDVSNMAAAAKLFCTEMVGRVADRVVQIFGGAGYISEYKVERFYRDVRLLRLYEGTSQIQQIVIAKNLTTMDHPNDYYVFG
ncbi:acyl-CoA dehydrogenase family protein [Melaminivora sp.]|uniref:acyl-CoA dehydrogenase family protein n=1 Tax=Melaminivora sp. TaxID=1933032 RepID=UPI0028AC762A|nr:acyl-CoA dehydrogenase family protein [Melaminivora sp.]